MSKKSLDICLSPDLLHLYTLDGKIVVVVDILRATSSIITALAHYVERIIPVSKLEQCEAYKKLGYVTAAERDGKKAEGFDLGNSPFSYMSEDLKGQTIVLTTTNGTEAINRSKAAEKILIGGFINLRSLTNYLISSDRDIIILCSGWKGRVNVEDTLFAGALATALDNYFDGVSDDVKLSKTLYDAAQMDVFAFIQDCSHVKRLRNLGIEKDIKYCLTESKYEVVPYFDGEAIVK